MNRDRIEYVVGDATQPGARPAILVHVCNDVGGWGAGFVLAVSKRWPQPESEYRKAFASTPTPGLGTVQFVDVEPGVVVANLIGQRGLRRGADGTPPVRYDAIRAGLRTVAERAVATGESVHLPRIGCGLAGGRWEEIEPLLLTELSARGVPVTVYDLPSR